MEQQDDPYEILGLDNVNATASQIRSAYRKAALRCHPDKVSAAERPAANIRFAKISNAYEILSDPQKREQYHLQQQQQQAGGGGGGGFSPGYYEHDPSYPHGHDNFGGFDAFFARGGFHDPFQVFQSVFREEFGGRPHASFSSTSSHRASPLDSFVGGDLFDDPFFRGGGPSPLDSFFGPSMFGSRGGGGGPFGTSASNSISRRQSRDPFEDMFASMHTMQRQMQEEMLQSQQQQQRHRGNNNNNNHHQSFYYSSTSSSAGPGGESVTTQTTRRIVNGQEQVVTERIVRKADGSVERQVLNNHEGNTNLLQRDNAGRHYHPALAQEHEEERQQSTASHGTGFSRLLPWSRRRSDNNTSRKQQQRQQQQESDIDLTPAKRSPAEAGLDNQKRRREP